MIQKLKPQSSETDVAQPGANPTVGELIETSHLVMQLLRRYTHRLSSNLVSAGWYM